MNKAPNNATQILDRLKRRYPVAESQLNFAGPWQVLVATVLAAQCTDERVNRVTPKFFELWPDPQRLAEANVEDVEEVIHSVGCFHHKAKNLIATAKIISGQYQGTVPASMDELLKLPGIARKTANIILFAGYGLNEGMAVDTHVKRISYRLGLTESEDPKKIEKDLMNSFPQNEWGDLNHRMVWFGREVCKARKPACEACELAQLCRHRREQMHDTRKQEEGNVSKSSVK